MPNPNLFFPLGLGNTDEAFRPLGVMDPALTRTHYFDGRLLKASDLIRDQLYLDQRLRESGRALGSGVARGLVAGLNGGRLTVSGGIAIAPSGRVLELRDDLAVDLTDVAALSAHNKGKLRHFDRGLYAVTLRLAEAGQGAAEAFPQDPSAPRAFRFDAFVEGVEVVLVRLRTPAPVFVRTRTPNDLVALTRWSRRELGARVELGRSLLVNPGQPPELPEDAVALAVVAFEEGVPIWLDRGLVFRPFRAPGAPAAFQHDVLAHYSETFARVLEDRRRSGLDGDFPARQYFATLPPAGPLPKEAIDPVRGRQSYFPDTYRVSVAPIRIGDLGRVLEEVSSLEVLDLASGAAEDVLVLAPLSEADFTWQARRLEREETVQRKDLPPLLLLPRIDPLRLRFRPLPTPHVLDTDAAVWREIWDRVRPEQLVYVRQPARVTETRVSTVVLARGFKLPAPGEPPEAERLSRALDAEKAKAAGFEKAVAELQKVVKRLGDRLAAKEVELAEAQRKLTEANDESTKLRATLAAQNTKIDALNARIKELVEGDRDDDLQKLLRQAIKLRGLRDQEALRAAEKLLDLSATNAASAKLVLEVLELVGSSVDRALWPTFLELVARNDRESLLRLQALARQADETSAGFARLVAKEAASLRLSASLQKLWKVLVTEAPNG